MSLVLDSFGCMGNTIKVSAGHYFDLANPDPQGIEIKSIAAALSKTCRFGGHCPAFYSVAEHSVTATLLARDDGHETDALKAVFLHDAAEAYIGDVVKPLKMMLPELAIIEDRIEQAIEKAFNIDFSRHRSVIKIYDRAMLKVEKQFFWPQDMEKWEGMSSIELRSVQLALLRPARAEESFLELAMSLGLLQ